MKNTQIIDSGERAAVRLTGAVNALEALAEAMAVSHDTARSYADAAAFLADILRGCARDINALAEESRK